MRRRRRRRPFISVSAATHESSAQFYRMRFLSPFSNNSIETKDKRKLLILSY